MKIYESAQDYLETILILNKSSQSVRSIDIANEMNVTKQSVHRAIKNLKNDEYITVDENGYITLTKKGKKIADEIARADAEEKDIRADFAAADAAFHPGNHDARKVSGACGGAFAPCLCA